jgi:hypothetical protein
MSLTKACVDCAYHRMADLLPAEGLCGDHRHRCVRPPSVLGVDVVTGEKRMEVVGEHGRACRVERNELRLDEVPGYGERCGLSGRWYAPRDRVRPRDVMVGPDGVYRFVDP